MENHHHEAVLTDSPLSLSTLKALFSWEVAAFAVSDKVLENVTRNAQYLHAAMAKSEGLHYGVNTGFGSLCNVRIGAKDLEQLQHNLIMSHACGMGAQVPTEIVRLMLLLKIKNLSLGYSAVREILLLRMVEFYRLGVLPVVFELGSLGASGDLAPLAHLALPLIGLGEVWYKGQRRAAAEVLAELELAPLRLAMKEGLALLNGTQFCLSYGIHSYWQTERLLRLADMIAALSIDAFACVLSPFDARLHAIRPHSGQIATAKNILDWLDGSPLSQTPKTTVQDPYSFRCVPQVHGASKDAAAYVAGILQTELNSVTDNPTVFDQDEAILSGGNFHAQPLALAMDFLAIAVAEIGSISERRLYQLISGQRDLPPMLTPKSGLHSGLMITQYAAASIVSQNKQLCTPASVDSIVSCNGQEDHVSMGANAGTKLLRVVQNVEHLLTLEFMAAAQALSFRALPTSPKLQKYVDAYRQIVPVLADDRVMSQDIETTTQFLRANFE
jgi:histidine ammonia-lyase